MKVLICILLGLSCVAVMLIIVEHLFSLVCKYRTGKEYTMEESNDGVESPGVEEFVEDNVEAFLERIEELKTMENVIDGVEPSGFDEPGTEIIFNSYELAFENKYGE